MSSRYSLALVGCGRIAQKHLRAMKTLQSRIQQLYLVDPAPEAHLRVKAEIPGSLADGAESFSSLSELLSQHKVDLVILTTPPFTHYSLGLEALEAGAALLIEKPICLDPREAFDLARRAADKRLPISVAYIYRFFPLMDTLKQDIERGLFGRFDQAEIEILWGHDQSYYDAGHWRGSWLGEGGVLMNQCIHALDLLAWLSGRELTCVKNGVLSQRLHRLEAEDTGSAELTYGKDLHARLFATTAIPDHEQPDRVRTLLFSMKGSGGSLLLRKNGSRIRFSAKIKGRPFYPFVRYPLALIKEVFREGPLFFFKKLTNPHLGIYADLFCALDSGRPSKVSAVAAAEAVEAVCAIYRSARLGGTEVELPLSDFRLQEMEGFFEK